jgi:EAL domain-containing protein (putative c-di-GMP-specific phosphodiesterase class I)/ActR/RegA family two-component response regulator
LKAERLLILDDEAAVGNLVRTIAEGFGLKAQATTAPAEFFALIEQWNPTHIALDLVMPEMDGVQVLTELARGRCNARIIITSGVGGKVLEAARRAAGENGLRIVGVLSKPFHSADLRNLLFESETGVFPAIGDATVLAAHEPTEGQLRAAIDRDELELAFQPKVRCTDGTPVGFEALVRWRRAGNLVLPAHFVPLAERAGLIDALTEAVFRKALAWMCSRFPGTSLSIAVNISARSLVDRDLADRIFGRCEQAGLAPARLTLELTESSAMGDPVRSLELLTRLRVRGFHLAIDDFGTGYSSMVQLVRLPFSEIKVDKSFVMEVTRSAEARAVVKSVIDLGHSLGLTAVAEGVEDAATLEFLRSVNCDLAQGYFVAPPMPGAEAAQWIAAWPGFT